MRVHGSQVYRKMDVTRARISRILKLREIFLSFQTGFNLVAAAVVCATLESISGLKPSSVITEPRYLKLVTVSSFCPFTFTTIGVRQECLLSPTLFNIFLERIMTDALEDHEGTVSIGGRTINNLRFADDIDGLAGEEEELANLVEPLDKASAAHGMEISAEKTKLMTNNTSGFNTMDRSLRLSQASSAWAQL